MTIATKAFLSTKHSEIAPPRAIGLGSGALGNLSVQLEDVEVLRKEVQTKLEFLAERRVIFRQVRSWLGWLAALSSAAITLTVGWYGKFPDQKPSEVATGLPQRTARFLAVLAAFGAICAIFESRLSEEAEVAGDLLDEVHATWQDTRGALGKTTDSQAAQALIDDMRVAILR